jgi:peptidoglycan/xylan/chitin deacetylase (PgdA/CDA1 family)
MTPRRVTLTFDNGPTPGITERVIEILDRQNIRTTFFVIGRNLDDAAAAFLTQKAHAAGHWIGNHTFTHSVALGDRTHADYAAREIGDSSAASQNGLTRINYSGPMGTTALLDRICSAKQLLPTCWQTALNSVPGDWKDAAGWVETCISQVLENDWSVVVLHDIEQGCLPRLPELLQRLNDLGVVYEQDYPESVVLTRAGKLVNMEAGYISD